MDNNIENSGSEDSGVTQDMLDELSAGLFPDTKTESTNSEESANEPQSAEKTATADTQQTTATTSVQTGETTGTTTTATTDKAPNTWKPEVAAKFNTLPDDVRAEILKREQDVFNGINQYKVAAEYGQNVHKMLQPYQERLSQQGMNPIDYLGALANADNLIASASTQEQKLQYFRELANHYGITIDHGLFGAEDSTVTALRKEIQDLKSSVNSQLTQAQAKELATIQKTIDEFKAMPEHKHFDVLQHEIAALLQSGVAKDLKDAYDRALWANPTTRAAEQARLSEEKLKADAEASKKALEEAKKKKGINVKSTVSGSNGVKKSIDETLNDAYDALQSSALN
jgi:hypothetical protein